MNICSYQPLNNWSLFDLNLRFKQLYKEVCYLKSQGSGPGSASLTSSYIGVGNGSNLLSGNSDFIKGAYVVELNQSSGGQQVGFMAKNTSASSGNTNASLFMDNGTSAGQLFKAGTNYSAYKNISAHDLGFYNNSVAGNISVLNDYGNINFAAEGGSTATMTIKNGNVGIGTSTPTSTLHVNGSVNLKVNVIADADYTVLDTDYMISCKNWTSDWTVTLPTGVTGRTLIFVPSPSANDYKTFFSADVVDEQRIGHDNIRSSIGGTITIMYDGADWQVVTNTKAW